MRLGRDNPSLRGKENIPLGSSLPRTGSNNVTKKCILKEHCNNKKSRSAFGILYKQTTNKQVSLKEKNLKMIRDEPSKYTHIDEWTDEISRMLTGSNIMSQNAHVNFHKNLKKRGTCSLILDDGKDVSKQKFSNRTKSILNYSVEHEEKHPVETIRKRPKARYSRRNHALLAEENIMKPTHTTTKRYRCVNPIASVLNHSASCFEGQIGNSQYKEYQKLNSIEEVLARTIYETSIDSLPIFTNKLKDSVGESQRILIKKPAALYPSQCNIKSDGIEPNFSFVT